MKSEAKNITLKAGDIDVDIERYPIPFFKFAIKTPNRYRSNVLSTLSCDLDNGFLLKPVTVALSGLFHHVLPLYVADNNSSSQGTPINSHKDSNCFFHNNFVRREGDLNPRWTFIHTRFPSVHLKPLGHLSI